MNRKILIATTLLFCFILVSVFYFWQTNHAKPKIVPTPYQNSVYGFSLEIPVHWADKYAIWEREKEIEFIYLKDAYRPIEKKEKIFKILILEPKEWQKIKSESGYHGSEIYKDKNIVFVYIVPLENPYSIDQNYQKETEEFQKMVGEVQEIIKTFKFSPEKISCAKKGEKINRNPLIGLIDQKCCQDLVEWRVGGSYSFCLEPTQEEIIIDLPKENEKVKSPLKISGKAKGNWFFEAEFTAELYDKNDNFMGKAILVAKDEWMTENFVSFEGVLEFSGYQTDFGKLYFLSNNASGLPEHQKIFQMSVQFEKLPSRKVLLYYYNPEKDKDYSGNVKCSKDGLVALEREIPVSKMPIKDTIELLLKGRENLTEKDLNQGITTEYPITGFKFKSANLKDDGTLILEFEDPQSQTIGGSCRAGILWFQIEATAKQFPEVKKVRFLPTELFQP